MEQSVRKLKKGPKQAPAMSEVAIDKCFEKLVVAFPDLTESFQDLLLERLEVNKFTDDRLQQAVTGVIEHCTYPTPTIANFLKWDRDHPWRIMETGRWFYLDKTGAYVSRDGDVYMA